MPPKIFFLFVISITINYSFSFKYFKFKIADNTFEGKIFTPLGPPPQIGESIVVTIKKTGFNLTIDQICQWLSVFGTIEGTPEYKPSDKIPNYKSDSVEVLMKLKKHVPSMLPAFGRKMFVQYRGQPIQCGMCYGPGHVRKECKNPQISWMGYVRKTLEKWQLDKKIYGVWIEYLNSNNRITEYSPPRLPSSNASGISDMDDQDSLI